MNAASLRNAVSRTLLIATLCVAPHLLISQSSPAPQPASSAAYGNCPAPSKPGVNVCSPTGGTQSSNPVEMYSPFQVIAAATGGNGAVNHIELWVDGKKLTQSSGSLFDQPVNFPINTHRVTLVEVDNTGAFVRGTPFYIEDQGSSLANQCAAPSSPGVNVCIPQGGNCHTAPWTTIVAKGTGASGTVARMELWVNGVKLANFPGNSINTNLYISDFSKVTIIEVDSAGNFLKASPFIDQSC